MADALFSLTTDADFYKSITADVADMFFREVEVRIIDRDKTQVDPLYNESKNIKYQSFVCRMQMDIKPKKAKLTKFGLDEARELMISVEVSVLVRGSEEFSTGFPTPSIGDVIIVEGELYEIMQDGNNDYWWHTEVPFTHIYGCDRIRDRSVDDKELVDPNNPAGPVQVPNYVSNADYPGEEK